MKIAYLCEPQLGGTYSFFKILRPLLAKHGMDFVCVSEASPQWFSESRFSKDDGVICAALDENSPLPERTRNLVSFLQLHGFDAVMTLPACSVTTSNLPRYLPHSLKCFIRVPMMTRGAYAPVRAMQRYVNAIVPVSTRIQTDLVKYGVDPDLMTTIFHGVPTDSARLWEKCKSVSGPLRLLYAGRLTDLDKGVLLLPDIMKFVRNAGGHACLSVVGGGEDETRLKNKVETLGLSDCIDFLGRRSTEEMPSIYRNSDVLLLPSRFEGCGFSLLEAMAQGCAPIASDIHGSIRVILDDGHAGKLAPVGNARFFAKAVLKWENDREDLRQTQNAAFMRVSSEYTLDKMGQAYANVFASASQKPDSRAAALDISQYDVPKELRPTWRTLIPVPIKNRIRSCLEKFSISV